ncbi:hypothetical protein BDF22DRAFT_667266 [Syncephalis plumigaleata]|nr:hypothetical protein BDF22DRAFT_667266 [Syncephalis plumigaleata]
MSVNIRHSLQSPPVQTWSQYLMNLADTKTLSNNSSSSGSSVVTATANCPSREYYTPDNLVACSTTSDNNTSWMADTFVRPPVTLTFTFRQPVELVCVVTGSNVGRHTIKSMSLSVHGRALMPTSSLSSRSTRTNSSDNYRWKSVGQADIPSSTYATSRHMGQCVLFNLSPYLRIASLMHLQENLPASRSSRLDELPIIKDFNRYPLIVDQVTMSILSMYDANVPSLPFIELWAIPGPSWSLSDWCSLPNDDSNNDNIANNASQYDRFIDPITQEIMHDPVLLPSGHHCDRYTNILYSEHYDNSNNTDITRHSVNH